MEKHDGFQLTEEQRKRQKSRNIAIALSLVGLVIIFYVVTVVKLGPGVVDRPF